MKTTSKMKTTLIICKYYLQKLRPYPAQLYITLVVTSEIKMTSKRKTTTSGNYQDPKPRVRKGYETRKISFSLNDFLSFTKTIHYHSPPHLLPCISPFLHQSQSGFLDLMQEHYINAMRFKINCFKYFVYFGVVCRTQFLAYTLIYYIYVSVFAI